MSVDGYENFFPRPKQKKYGLETMEHNQRSTWKRIKCWWAGHPYTKRTIASHGYFITCSNCGARWQDFTAAI